MQNALLYLAFLSNLNALSDCEIIQQWIPNIITSSDCCNYNSGANSIACDSKGRVTNMQVLSILTCRILTNPTPNIEGSLPKTFYDLTSLQKMWAFSLTTSDLSINSISGSLLPEIGQLTKLQSLTLSQNDLTGNLPTRIGELTTLSEILLDQNHFVGPIPTQIKNLQQLTYL